MTATTVDSGNYVNIMAYDGGLGTTAGEATVMTFAIPGVTATPVTSNLARDADWTFHSAGNIVTGAAPNQRLNAYVVPAGKVLVITRIQISFIDVVWPSVDAFATSQEASDGRYGHGVRWTARVSGQPVAPWSSVPYPLGGRHGCVNPARNATPYTQNRLQQYVQFDSRVWIEVYSGQYFTLSGSRATDTRSNDLYGGAGTKLWVKLGYGQTNISVLEHHIRVQGIYADVGSLPDWQQWFTMLEDYNAAPTLPNVTRPAP